MLKTTIETSRLTLKLLDEQYADMVSAFLSRNKDYFAPYETEKNPFFYSPMYQKNVLANEFSAAQNKQYLRYYVFLKGFSDTIIGTVSFGTLMPYPYSSCVIGYRFDEQYTGYGYATEAVRAAICEAFNYLPLHRINAYIMENNLPSIHLIENVGFHYEGTCESNIKIRGQWESHRLYALIDSFCN